MVICDICKEHHKNVVAGSSVHGMDLCEEHREELGEAIKLAVSIFKSVRTPTDEYCTQLIQRMMPSVPTDI